MKLRVLVVLVLCLQVFLANGQRNNTQIITLNDALNVVIGNHAGIMPDDHPQLAFDVKSAWHEWLFSINKERVLHEYLQQVKDIEQMATFQYKSGNIEWIDYSSWLVKLARIRTQEAVAANETEIAMQVIRKLLLVEHNIAPADTNLLLYQIDKTGWHENTAARPYILNDSVPAGNPAFTNAQDIRIRQLELDGLFIQLQFFYSFGLPHAETILRVSGAKLKCEENGYLEYADQVAEAFIIKLDFLETLRRYNQCALQLEYHAY